MKSYNEFIEYVKANVTDYLPEEFEKEEITIQQVVKNNNIVLDGLMIFSHGSHVSPAVYLNPLYEQYKEGKDLDEIVSNIADAYIENIEPVVNREFQAQLEDLGNYEIVKDYIFPKLVNLEKNSIRLQDAPYTQREDLAVTYYIKVLENSYSMSSLMITNFLMGKYGVTLEELHALAMENLEQLSPVVCVSLMDTAEEVIADGLSEREGLSDEEAREHAEEIISNGGMEMYYLSNEFKINGAVCIINENVQQMVADQVGGDYYILPSSVHEVIIVPKRVDVSPRDLTDMVNAINANFVSEDEYLSDKIYQYDAKEHKFSMCIPQENLKMELKVNLEQVRAMQEEKNTLQSELTEQSHESMKHSGKIH